MHNLKIVSRKLGLTVLLLSFILIVCAVPAAGAFIAITNCPETVTQGSVLTISGDAPGISKLKLTLSSLSATNFNSITVSTTVKSDDSFSFSIDTSKMPEGQYLAVVSADSFEKGKDATKDLMAKVSFIVISRSSTPSPLYDYSTSSPTTAIDNTKTDNGGNQDSTGIIVLGTILGIVVVGGLAGWFIHGVLKQSRIQKNTSAANGNTKEESLTKWIGSSNSTTKYCSNCGTEIDDDAVFCKKCGTKIEQADTKAKYCTNCGTEIDDDAVFCKKCGTRIEHR